MRSMASVAKGALAIQARNPAGCNAKLRCSLGGSGSYNSRIICSCKLCDSPWLVNSPSPGHHPNRHLPLRPCPSYRSLL